MTKRKMRKVLFIIKRQLGYHGSLVPSKGLFNSAHFVVNALRMAGHKAELVEVIDGNDIDREVTRYQPSHCVIEALWVTPEKMDQLRQLHQNVKFIVRLHSKVPFLATEGIAMGWLQRYTVPVAFNSRSTLATLKPLLNCEAHYLPNIYQPESDPWQKKLDRRSPNLWVGCLGAVRPLKNQLQQALAARHYAERTNRRLIFHINDRVEQGGESVLKNIRALFECGPHRLIVQQWCQDHAAVLRLVASFDLSMQVSFTETFNIASADAVWVGVPVVVSEEVSWAVRGAYAEPSSLRSMMETMERVERAGLGATKRNLRSLLGHNERSLISWNDYLAKGK